jgi:hypothetical protein
MGEITVYTSGQCPNCTRLVQSMSLVPSLRNRTRIVDISTLDHATLSRIQFVPTVVLSSGQSMVGTKAFEWMKEFDGEVELAPPPSGGLAFSDLDFADTQYTEGFSSFEPLPE